MHRLLRALRAILRPARILAGKFVILPPGSTDTPIFLKAASVTSAEQLEGDYLEFGVYTGNSLIRAYELIKYEYEARFTDPEGLHSPEYRTAVRGLWDKMRFFAFDSFQGLPFPKGLDTQTRDFEEGKFRTCLDAFWQNIRLHSVDAGKVVPVVGWFEDTCNAETIAKHGMKGASIIHIDCDYYESTKVVLEFIEPLLLDGTVLIFDDWYCFRGNPGLGEQRAFREWSQNLKGWVFTEFQKEGAIRNSFIASRVL